MSITIHTVSTPKQLKQFIHFRHQLYENDPNYVPQLNLTERTFLSKKNPFFKHSEAAYFLAFDEKKVVGRIATIYNKNHLDRYEDNTGFFGFFDSINDEEVAHNLLEKAADWLRQKGLKYVIGPENFTTNDSVGILTDGFDKPPVVQMPYNKNYYEKLLLSWGMEQVMELYAYCFHQVNLPEDFMEMAEKIERRLNQKGISIRTINFKNFKNEMNNLRQVYNIANDKHWGFVPLTDEEFMFLAADLRQIVSKENVLLAEKNGELIGYMVTIPDVNQIFAHISNGKLLPFGWTKLVWKPKITGARMLILGVLPAYRHFGIDWCFYAHTSRFFQQSGIEWTEAGYVMQDNRMMNRIIKKTGGERTKTYRLFGKDING